MKDFFSFSQRIDSKIKYIISIKGIRTMPLILQLKHDIDNSVKRKLSRMGFKIKYEIHFLNYICGSLPIRNFDNLKALIEINKIYYDDKAALMGKMISPSDTTANTVRMKSQLLNGRGISIGFIDSGVHPRAAFMKPRRRILAFRDFLQDKRDPYDDSGHGTAAIAAASIPAAEAGIICAKAFDASGHGSFSDIIASMDWILSLKEKYNIKVVVLNFGTEIKYKNTDVLALAAETLWKNGLLVISCAGNLGPEWATITSPGHIQRLLTIGALDAGMEKPLVFPWSSRGPVKGSSDKPDLVMPGFIPSEGLMGTSASASIAAGFAALLYEKKPEISPEDAKSLLKLCTSSLGELKQAQGKGFIDIKKIEEL